MAFKPAPIPSFEIPRLKELYSLDILNNKREKRFDRYVRLAADIFSVPIANIILMDAKRELYKASVGVKRKTALRDVSFCSYTILEKENLIVPNIMKFPRFIDNPLVTEKPKVRFYAGAVLRGPTGQPIGTLCILDTKPRTFNKKNRQTLLLLARMVEHELHYRYYLSKLEKNIETNFYYDPVTKTANKRLFLENLKSAINTAKREKSKKTITVVVLQMRHYDELFQAYGRKTIERLVKQIAERLKVLLKNFSCVLGHEYDYFMIFFHGNDSNRTIANMMKPLLACFSKPFSGAHKKQHISAVLGVSHYPQDGADANILLEKALVAMQSGAVKHLPYQVYSMATREALSKNFDLLNRLQKALEKNKLQVIYQPKIGVKNGRVCGAEALSFWRERKEIISPGIFIPLAEKNNLILPLTYWLLETVCQDIQRWRKKKTSIVPVAINVPSDFLLNSEVLEKVKSILEKYNIKANDLQLEITESSLVTDMKNSIKKMSALTHMGFSFAIDDFGTGYSSFGYLSQLPVQTLKIDRSFIQDMEKNSSNSMLVRAIIELSKKLNLEVVAEGVETVGQFECLRAYQCDQIQGYLFSRPVSSLSFEKILMENKDFIKEINDK